MQRNIGRSCVIHKRGGEEPVGANCTLPLPKNHEKTTAGRWLRALLLYAADVSSSLTFSAVREPVISLCTRKRSVNCALCFKIILHSTTVRRISGTNWGDCFPSSIKASKVSGKMGFPVHPTLLRTFIPASFLFRLSFCMCKRNVGQSS